MPGGPWISRAKATLLFVAAMLFVLIVIEGFSSLVIVGRRFVSTQDVRIAEKLHTRYDPLLGWINIPNLRRDDFFGPGTYFQTNSQGFRNDEDFTEAVPPGRIRAICSGDSFTEGYGVSNPDSWCAQLERVDPRLQTVNMGQGGYGIDQSYLWFQRDAEKLQHQIHLFAFVEYGFPRMAQSQNFGYGKPVLTLEGGALEVTNVPVPRGSYLFPVAFRKLAVLRDLRTVRLAQRLLGTGSQRVNVNDQEATLALGTRVFEELQRLNASKGSQLVLVFLPIGYNVDEWYGGSLRERIADIARQRRLRFIDLTDDMSELGENEVSRMYIAHGAVPYLYAAGHYSAPGNAFVAARLHQHLVEQGILRP